MGATGELLEAVRNLKSDELRERLARLEAERKAVATLLRATMAQERTLKRAGLAATSGVAANA